MESHVKGDNNNPGLTYVSIHKNMAERATGYMQKYEEFIINYAVEWERVLTERVSEDIKRVDNHKRDLDHYVKKVESLRAANDKNLAKGMCPRLFHSCVISKYSDILNQFNMYLTCMIWLNVIFANYRKDCEG